MSEKGSGHFHFQPPPTVHPLAHTTGKIGGRARFGVISCEGDKMNDYAKFQAAMAALLTAMALSGCAGGNYAGAANAFSQGYNSFQQPPAPVYRQQTTNCRRTYGGMTCNTY